MLTIGLRVVGCPSLLLFALYMDGLTSRLPSSGAVMIQMNCTYATSADNMVVNFEVTWVHVQIILYC
jgi:hypothetical protein